MTSENGPALSFFQTYLDEIAGPFTFEADGDTWIIDAPDPDIGPALDNHMQYIDVFELLAESLTDDEYERVATTFDARPQHVLVDLVEAILWHWGLVNAPADGFSRVVAEFDRYGPAFEYDLACMGVDLAQWIREPERHSWAKLLRFLQRLPAGGHYSAALANDVELAEAIAEQAERDKAAGKPPPEARPSLIGWTYATAMQQAMFDQMRRLEWATFAASTKFKGRGGKPPQAQQRPRTAADLVHTRKRWREHDDIAGQLLGKRYKPHYND